MNLARSACSDVHETHGNREHPGKAQALSGKACRRSDGGRMMAEQPVGSEYGETQPTCLLRMKQAGIDRATGTWCSFRVPFGLRVPSYLLLTAIDTSKDLDPWFWIG
jgi:hypothetical protein